jgi:uncharacterized protein YaaR (DUF327 family)
MKVVLLAGGLRFVLQLKNGRMRLQSIGIVKEYGRVFPCLARVMNNIPENTVSHLNPAVYANLNVENKKIKHKATVREGKETLFAKIFDETIEEQEKADARFLTTGDITTEETLQELMDAVHSTGDSLRNHPLPNEVMHYKKAVKDFLRYVVENTYVIEQEIGIPNSLKPGFKKPRSSPEAKERKTYQMIQVVDRKLDQLAAVILAGQSTQLDILARLEEITGILVDLLQ